MRRHLKASSARSIANRNRGKSALIATALAVVALGIAAAPALAAPPTVSLTPGAFTASYTSAHVEGKVNPEDNETFYYFQYSAHPEIEGWNFAAFPPALAANSGEATVSEDFVGLSPGTKYFVRLVATNNIDPEVISAEPNPSFTTLPVAPPGASIAAPSSVTGASAHFSGQITPGTPAGDPAAFDVSWRFQCNPECPGLGNHTIPADSGTTEVFAADDTTGLKPATTYEVTLVAENAGGQTVAGPEFFTTDPVLPEILDVGAAPSATEAEFKARINPGGAETTYHFDYGPTASYGQSTPSRTLPAGLSATTVSAHVSGLLQASGYHLRLVAENSAGVVESPDRTFTTSQSGSETDSCPNAAIRAQQGSSWLADCRAYERVSPADNAGVAVQPGNAEGFMATTDGDRALFTTAGASYPGSEATPLHPKALATRTATGWLTKPLDKPITSTVAASLFKSIWAVSRDLTRMVVTSTFSLGGKGVAGNSNLYIYDIATGEYTLVMTSPDLSLFAASASENITAEWFGGSPDFSTIAFGFGRPNQIYVWSEDDGLRSIGVGDGLESTAYGAVADIKTRPGVVSEDGSRIYYRDEAGAAAVNENGTSRVISISRRAGDPPDPVAACPEMASPDGRFLFFSANAPLTDDATAGTSFYRYDAESDSLEYLANLASDPRCGVSGPPTGVVQGWPERSEAYLRRLIDGNLYRFHDGQLTIAVPDPFGGATPGTSASPDGRYLAVVTGQQLTDYENDGIAEAYLYDSQTESLSCASCREDGAAPSGSASGITNYSAGSFGHHVPAAVTNDGTVYFDTPDPLIATDVNGTRDVYSYRDGQVTLISPGTQPVDARFAEVTPSGHDVFFTTVQRLVASDRDNVLDLYDARAGGGIAAQSAVPVPPCSGDACRGAGSSAPEAPGALTEMPFGSEGPRPGAKQRCGKSRSRQAGKGKSRCIKQPKKHGKKQARNRSVGR
ncbi:MAG TPA: hypothetical protein VLL27_08995 [Solirubrobacterales bacterium]|nr:hypothetical protein [Solirubrobacterales bacterium]